MDAGRRALARTAAAAQARAPAALSPGLRRRARADRRLRAWVVRGPRPAVHALGVHRRRDEPSHAPALRADRVDLRLLRGHAGLPAAPRQAGGVLLGQARRVPGQPQGRGGGDGMTQFGRALDQLNIDIICANVPQAKGRVERANGTLQDRLVKEMRLAGLSTIEAGNQVLPAFMADYNRRFAKEPRSDKDLHRPVSEHDQLDEAFAWKEDRTVSNSLTLQYDHVLIILEPTAVTRPLARQRVTVFDYPDGRLAIKHKGLKLPSRTFDKRQRVNQAAVVENKRLGPVLAYIAERQKELDMGRSKKAPRRRGQGPSLFKVG